MKWVYYCYFFLYLFQPYWGIIDKIVIYLKYVTLKYWFDTCIHGERILTMEFINTSITIHV